MGNYYQILQQTFFILKSKLLRKKLTIERIFVPKNPKIWDET